MDEYLLFEYLLFNIHFSPCSRNKVSIRIWQPSVHVTENVITLSQFYAEFYKNSVT